MASAALDAVGSLADDFINDTLCRVEKPVFYHDMTRWTDKLGGGLKQFRDQHIVNKRMAIDPEFQIRYLVPGMRTVFTDVFASVLNQQQSICAPLELQALECIEYYGKQRGLVICKDFYDDFIECRNENLQFLRWETIQAEYRKRWWREKRGQLSDREKDEIEKNNGYVWRDVPQGNVHGRPLKHRFLTPGEPHHSNW